MNIIEQEEAISIKNNHKEKSKNKKLIFIFQILGFLLILILLIISLKKLKLLKLLILNNLNLENENTNNKHFDIRLGDRLNAISQQEIELEQKSLEFESYILHLSEINKKRTFEKRYPLPDIVKCYEHIREGGLKDLMAFTSFLTNETIFFEYGSGCTSLIAKYYAKKSYSVEGDKEWYEKGIKNGLKDNIIFKDIKPNGSGELWSTPGKDSNIEDWKKYFQAYNQDYNANVIFIDGRFRVACAFDIFNKIKDDTIILIHEYFRPQYIIIEKYYDYIYHWGSLFLFKKKNNIKEIPLDFQKKYWKDST